VLDLPYRFHQRDGWLPLCDVIIIGRDRQRARVQAVVDSGAVLSFFPITAAADAGIDLSTFRPFYGIFGGSTDPGRVGMVDVRIADRGFRIEICFVERVGLGYAMLGRKGLFSLFDEVAFMEKSLPRRVQLRTGR
jgi:hypothetical protein